MAFDMIVDNKYSLSGKDVYLPSRPAIPPNKKRMQYIEIPGRDGTISIFDGYEDRPFPIDFNIYDILNVNEKMRNVNPILLNAKTIHFTDDLDIYYKVKEFSLSDRTRLMDKAYEFSADVTIEPFDYSIEGAQVVTLSASTSIYNPGTYYSEPHIIIYGSGTVNMSIGSYSLEVKNVSDYVEIDSSLFLCYKEATAKGQDMSGNFPYFEVGTNQITLSSNITKVEIIPNWRYL